MVMSSVSIKTYFQDKAKQLYKIAIHVSPGEIQGFPLKRGYARVYWQVSSKGSAGLLDRSSRAAQMWQLANYAAKSLAVFQLAFCILSENVLETVEQDIDDF